MQFCGGWPLGKFLFSQLPWRCINWFKHSAISFNFGFHVLRQWRVLIKLSKTSYIFLRYYYLVSNTFSNFLTILHLWTGCGLYIGWLCSCRWAYCWSIPICFLLLRIMRDKKYTVITNLDSYWFDFRTILVYHKHYPCIVFYKSSST